MSSLVNMKKVRTVTPQEGPNEVGQRPVGCAVELRLISVDDVDQSFQVAVLIHTHYKTSSIVPDSQAINEFIRDDKYTGFCPSIVMINTIAQQYSDWEITYRVNRRSGIVWTSFRNTFIINESLELQSFPFDRQLFRVGFKSADAALGVWDLPTDILDFPEAKTHEERCAPYLVSCELNTWHMSGITVGVASDDPDPVSLTAAEMEVTILCERDPRYHLWNFVLIMSAIVLTQAANIAVDPIASGERLGLSLTLLLTAVAFKNVLSSSLPKVGYSTLLDKYVSMSVLYLILGIAATSFMTPRVQCLPESFSGGDSATCMSNFRLDAPSKSNLVMMDSWFQAAYAAIWAFLTVVVVILCYVPRLIRPSWKYVIANQIGDIDSMIKRATYVQDLDGEYEGHYRAPAGLNEM